MRQARGMVAHPDPDQGELTVTVNPWDRYGWLMGAIWLVFLLFPLTAIFTSDHSVWGRVLGVVLILGFAAVYVHGFVRFSSYDTWDEVVRVGIGHLAALTAIALSTIPLLGADVLSLVPYIVAMAMFSLWLVWAFTVAAAGILLPIVVSLVLGDFPNYGYYSLVVVMVSAATGLVRVLEIGQERHREQAAELALATERDRVARDVHDVLGHSLTVVTLKAELAQRLVEVDPERARTELEEIQTLSRTALAEIRATVAGLRVARLADEVAAARTALSGADIRADLPTDLDVVDPRHRVLLAWILREAVTNVIRHSGATTCRVELHDGLLRVTDDGRGCGGQREGNGLRGIRERVASAGGTLTVGPGTENGTILEVQL